MKESGAPEVGVFLSHLSVMARVPLPRKRWLTAVHLFVVQQPLHCGNRFDLREVNLFEEVAEVG